MQETPAWTTSWDPSLNCTQTSPLVSYRYQNTDLMSLSQTIPPLIIDYWVTPKYLRCPSNIGHKYRLNNFPCTLYQVPSHWGAFLTQTGRGEIRAIEGYHLERFFFHKLKTNIIIVQLLKPLNQVQGCETLTEGVICGAWGGEAVSGGTGSEGRDDEHGEFGLAGLLGVLKGTKWTLAIQGKATIKQWICK